MKNLKLRNKLLLVFICNIMVGCVTLQQPLPGRLWGDWGFIKTGTLTENGNERLSNYRNVCYDQSDRLSFSSDKKLSLRRYDDKCMINYYLIGKYRVENNILIVDLADSKPYQDSPFPPITKYRIEQINHNNLKLEEIPDDYNPNRGRANTGHEPLVFIFMRID